MLTEPFISAFEGTTSGGGDGYSGGGVGDGGGGSWGDEGNGVFWIGQDGNVWVAGNEGVNSAGQADANSLSYWQNQGFRLIQDPVSPSESLTTQEPLALDGGGGGETDTDDALRRQLRREIIGRAGDIDSIYNSLFADLDELLQARRTSIEGDYGQQLKKVSKQYADALPEIANSYASIGAYDSTDRTSANRKSKEGFDETTATIGKNKETDLSTVGQFGKENRARFEADRTAARRNASRAPTTTDVNALRGLRNDLESNLDTAGVTRATLGTEGKARKDLESRTQDAGRYDQAVNALDSILKSSMSGTVKQAAVTAITDAAGLSDDEKEKIQQQYGNVYAEQAAL